MQFLDSENAQHNLEISQIPRLRGTYTSRLTHGKFLSCLQVSHALCHLGLFLATSPVVHQLLGLNVCSCLVCDGFPSHPT